MCKKVGQCLHKSVPPAARMNAKLLQAALKNAIRFGGLGRLAVPLEGSDTLPVVQVVGLPQLHQPVISRGCQNGAGDVPADSPDRRAVVVKLAGLADLETTFVFFVLIRLPG